MRRHHSLLLALSLTLGLAPFTAAMAADTAVTHVQSTALDGLWDGAIEAKDGRIPFTLKIGGPSDAVKVTFFDGERPVDLSTAGHLNGDVLEVEFASYATKLQAHFDSGVLHGSIGVLRFEASRHRPPQVSTAKPPSIGGVWEIPTDSTKGEKAWRLIVQEKPSGVFATILRIDGDTGTINGRYDGAKFNLSRYAGDRPTLLEITPKPDGTLALVLIDPSTRRELTAIRPAAARQAGFAAPDDPKHHTTVSNPAEPFRFSGADLDGKAISNADPRFKGKVVLLNIMGSWCPNCHDEAPFLAELDAKFRAKGLEVVGLDFEDAAALKDLSRLKAFIARYGLRYTVLVAGERKELNARLPQAVGLDAWPTTFFLGRDGKVRSIHVGFPSHGSAEYDRAARDDITKEVEALLAEPAR
jgi:thiol-disulfide isomerase/thioredoxin